MSILNKFLKIAGRDKNGNAKPIRTDSEGRIEISGQSSGGSSLNVKDVDSNEYVDITAIQDDQGEFVLRVVDAAPYIVEISRFDDATSSEKLLSEHFSEILPFNTDRKYVSFANVTNDVVLLSFGDNKPSVAIQPNSSFEMSAMNGNLYKGEIQASKLSASENLFIYDLIKQGGVFSDRFSDSLARTYSHPIPVTAGKTYGIYVDDPEIRIRNIYAYRNSTSTNGTNILPDGVYEAETFKIPEGRTHIAVSFCKTNTSYNLTPQETKNAEIKLTEQTLPLYVTEGV